MKMDNQSFRTKIAQNSGQEPSWTDGAQHCFYRSEEKTINLELWEVDTFTDKDYIGTAVIDIIELFSQKSIENKYAIYDTSKKNIGEVQLQIQVTASQNSVDKLKYEKEFQESQKKAQQLSFQNELEAKNKQKNKQYINQPQGIQPVVVNRVSQPIVDQGNMSVQNQVNQQQLIPPKANLIAPVNKTNLISASNLIVPKVDSIRKITKEQLDQKSNEIFDRLSTIQTKLQSPHIQIASEDVQLALLEGMKKLARERPLNPIRELGLFLVNYNAPQQIQQKLQNSSYPLNQSQNNSNQLQQSNVNLQKIR